MNGKMSFLPLFILFFVSCTSAAYIIPDASSYFTHCVGPDCPRFSLPMPVNRHGTHRNSMKCNQVGHVVTPDPTDCQSFYVCRKNGTYPIKLTCTNGYAFHPRIKMCVPESLVKSCGKVYCPPSILIGMVPDPENCTRFYKCVYGVPLHYQCEIGFMYDEELGKCMDYGQSMPTCVSGQEGEYMETSTSATEVAVTSTSTTTTVAPTDEITTTLTTTTVAPVVTDEVTTTTTTTVAPVVTDVVTTATTTTVAPVVTDEITTEEAVSVPISSD